MADPTSTGRLSTLSRSVAGRRVVVTGAASGMGRATAHLFADEGARVVVADLGAHRVEAVVAEIREVHGDAAAHGVVCDVARPEDLARLVQEAVAWGDGIDVVINNAGISVPNDCVQDEAEFEETWARSLGVNLTAHVRLVRYALPHLLRSDSPRVVNIASTEAVMAMPGLAGYAASKAGVAGLTRSLAVELGRSGITVNCILPGPIETAMTQRFAADEKQAYARRRVPLARYGLAEEVAQMTLNLCLPASGYVTGASIPVDGGLTIKHM
ncbi:SDR family NAD(P)-dependent oxidoreductase [Geodermatophilus amargosae]|uniref:SDR family NAD(P)-dependent oxidoreductase n=1 Tax=Geodermatophilus amargosae TaxID=1296565 RepID=UPI0034DEF0E3